jgi:hypothetical protein
MKTYEMAVVTQVLTVQANTKEEAEAKYDAYFNEDECPCKVEDCECVEDAEDCYHITTEIGELQSNE